MQREIKEAALQLFATNGYENTTMREIGKAVGIRGSSIYAHFQSKEEIFLAIVDDLLKMMVWEKVDTSKFSCDGEKYDLKSLLYKIFKSNYLFFAEHELELLFWQRIRFFRPPNMKKPYDLSCLLYDRPVVQIYTELFEYGVKTKQLNDYDVGLLVMSFFVFNSGYTDSLIQVPFKLTEQQLEQCFHIFWDAIRYKE